MHSIHFTYNSKEAGTETNDGPTACQLHCSLKDTRVTACSLQVVVIHVHVSMSNAISIFYYFRQRTGWPKKRATMLTVHILKIRRYLHDFRRTSEKFY